MTIAGSRTSLAASARRLSISRRTNVTSAAYGEGTTRESSSTNPSSRSTKVFSVSSRGQSEHGMNRESVRGIAHWISSGSPS